MPLASPMKKLAVFVLGGLVGVALAQGVLSWVGTETPEPPARAVAAAKPEDRTVASPQAADLRRAKPAEKSDSGDPAPAGIRDTRLPLRLLGTMVADPAERSQAVIVNVEHVHHMVLREGEALAFHPEVTVLAIEQRRVLLDTERGIERLWLSSGDGLPDIAAAWEPPAEAAGRPKRDRPLRSSAQLRRERDANVRPEVIEAMNRLGTHLAADLEPLYDASGRIEGVQAMSLADDGLLAKAGIERDEIIRGVNGVEIDTPEAASRVLRDLASCEPVMGMVAGPMGDREVEIGVELLEQFGCVRVTE